MSVEEHIINDLPDPEAARRFLEDLANKHPSLSARLLKKEGLLSDVLTLVAFSPLLATTLLQDPEYLLWLERKRKDEGVRSTEELLESLARFALTNSQVEPQVLFARFRRRELLRIYLRDIRRLATVPEITEELSNLADATLESALRLAGREMDNRYGQPQRSDKKGRSTKATFCVVALGKLGSRELNYSSDIDLLFLYSDEGTTSGTGSRGSVTNREYFAKLAEFTVKLVGRQTGEGAAYRVDLRLRPHGSLGAIAVSVDDAVRYYRNEARPWERQVLIRSRGCAGDLAQFRRFFAEVEPLVFESGETVEQALGNVRRSKESIDREATDRRGYDVKLGRGGIREIEFIAQALQLAFGRDKWLRSPHTLISLSRLADRGYLTDAELTQLASAYEFLRRTEHVLQMENGLQTHTVPDDPERRRIVAARVTFGGGGDFEAELERHTDDVSRIFTLIFGEDAADSLDRPAAVIEPATERDRVRSHVLASIVRSDVTLPELGSTTSVLDRLSSDSLYFSSMIAANPRLVEALPGPNDLPNEDDFARAMSVAAASVSGFGQRLAALRSEWSRLVLSIGIPDLYRKITLADSKRCQTRLAEATVDAALKVVFDELASRHKVNVSSLPLAVLALGKLGGRGIDYGSDLDLLLAYDDDVRAAEDVTNSELYGRAAELLVNVLSSMTRDGSLYRVDLRLRPYGSKGLSAMPANAFLTYMGETAAIWEMLAFVKLRAVGGDLALATRLETETRSVIHQRAAAIPPDELRAEAVRVREALEKQHSGPHRRSDIDIKYGQGGMLDVYFAMRFLQLRDGVADDLDDRSTLHTLDLLRSRGSLADALHRDLSAGYSFLTDLDHNLRLTIGRTTRVPVGNQSALEIVARRMKYSVHELRETLALCQQTLRRGFEDILSSTLPKK